MERTMRRFKQQLKTEDTKQILRERTAGVLSLIDNEGLPYGVPVSFAYDGSNTIYFHSAVQGRKIDCIGGGCNCSFCVVDRDFIVPEEFTSYFRSVIVSGKVSIVNDKEDILKGLLLLCEKYSPGEDSKAEIEKCIKHVRVLRLDISQMTGKEAIELVNERDKH